MGKYLIGNFVTEITAKYDKLALLLKPFEYGGTRPVEITLSIDENMLQSIRSRMVKGSTLAQAEELAYATEFNRAIVDRGAMLIHSSALVYNGGAYLFSAKSGVGKSTHTRLWKQAFGDKVKIINDDKPIVRIENNKCTVYGTPFDGGSGIALNESAPLKAVIFIERGEENSIRKASQAEIIANLYSSTVRILRREKADAMLKNFDVLIKMCDFYILTCNTDISAAYTAYDALIK